MLFVAVLLLCVVGGVLGASKNKPHSHQGVLQPYDGRPLPQHLTPDQRNRLDKGEAVVYNERDGKSGYGVVVQDINATSLICMSRISDLKNYHRMVPHVKSVDIYERETLSNGSTRIGAQFNVGLMGLSFGYFLKLRHEPKYNTFTWTQDYRYSSDFDDNVGHWQVTPHPSRSGWTRLLYSCKVKLLPWIPEFVVSFLTTKALTEATGWVKREAEEEQRKQLLSTTSTTSTSGAHSSAAAGFKLPKWFGTKGGSDSQGSQMQRLRERVEGKLAVARAEDLRRGAKGRGLLGGLARLRLPGKFGRL